MKNILNIPNAITFVRLLIIIPFLYFLANDALTHTIALFSIFIILDIADGAIAVKLKQETKFGKNFDFLTDALFGIGVYYVLILSHKIPAFIVVLAFVNYLVLGVLVFFAYRNKRIVYNSRLKIGGAIANFLLLFLLILNIYNTLTFILIYLCLGYMYYLIIDYYIETKKKFFVKHK